MANSVVWSIRSFCLASSPIPAILYPTLDVCAVLYMNYDLCPAAVFTFSPNNEINLRGTWALVHGVPAVWSAPDIHHIKAAKYVKLFSV